MATERIAILFDDLTEFYAVRGGIDDCLKNKVNVDIIVVDSGFNRLADDTYDAIKKLGYQVLKKPRNDKYKIVLEPYPMKPKNIKYDYLIKYRYGFLSQNKPYTLEPHWSLEYDAIMAFSDYEAEYLSAYSRIELIKPTNYRSFKKLNNTYSKPRLLILPTFGDVSCVDAIDDDVMALLKKQYHVTVKSHHAMQYRDSEAERYDKMSKLADDFFDSSKPVSELLMNADIVLSDNSGAIFDAIYSETSVALFTNDPNSGHKNEIDTIQSKLVNDGVIPLAKKGKDLPKALKKAAAMSKKQVAAKKKLLESNNASEFCDVILKYLKSDADGDMYKKVHSILVKEFYANKRKVDELTDLSAKLEQTNQKITTELKNVYSSTSWKMTKPVRNIGGAIKRIGGRK